jgi:hypothetical protein
VSIVAPEVVGKELRIFVYPQELTDDLDGGEHFRIPECCWGGPAPSEAPEVSDTVVFEAEDGDDDEGVKLHKKKTSSRSVWCYWLTPSVEGGLVFGSSPQRNLHTGSAKVVFNRMS